MGTQKRERQKANRAKRQAEEAKAARTSAVKRNALRWVIVAIAAIAAVVLIAWIGGATCYSRWMAFSVRSKPGAELSTVSGNGPSGC